MTSYAPDYRYAPATDTATSAVTITATSLFGFVYAISIIFHISEGVWALLQPEPRAITNAAVLIAAFALLIKPGSTPRLLIVGALQILDYINMLPVQSNHYTMHLFLNLSLIGAFLWFKAIGQGGEGLAQRLYGVYAPVGRYLLLMMYFYGIFHKINVDWLDPQVSCAVSLYTMLPLPFGLHNWEVGYYGAIYGTFFIEGVAGILLCVPRYKWYGFALGVPFHMAIGITGYAWYIDFSSIALALYVLFMADELAKRLGTALEGGAVARFMDAVKRNGQTILTGGVIVGLGLWALAGALQAAGANPKGLFYQPEFQIFCQVLWVLYSGTLYLGVLWLLRDTAITGVPKTGRMWVTVPVGFMIIPVLFFLNGLSPYLGLKSESSIAMYSNLHTEGGVSNHLLFPTLPYVFDDLSNVITIVDSNDRELNELSRSKMQLVEPHFLRLMAQKPDAVVTYTVNGHTGNGQTFASRSSADILAEKQPTWLQRYVLPYKPVDFQRPKVCSH